MMSHWFGFGVFDTSSGHAIGCALGSVTAYNEYLIKCIPFTNFSSPPLSLSLPPLPRLLLLAVSGNLITNCLIYILAQKKTYI